jgi:hypothetical protein
MTGKNKGEIPQSDIKKLDGFNYVVSEGSTVVFDLHDFISDKDIHIPGITFRSCRQIDSIPTVDLYKENDQIFSFIAPYVKGENVNTKLCFELTVNDSNSKTRDRPYIANVIVKRVQRAIIFQGGVALGAYEATDTTFTILLKEPWNDLQISN